MLTQAAIQQFQYLADKYAPAAPEIAETLAKLQLPPHIALDDTSPVPLPQRIFPQSQHHIALVIRDGRRAASKLTSLGEASKTTASGEEETSSHTSHLETSMSTTLEQDFTVEGKKGNLQCPFSQGAAAINGNELHPEGVDVPTSFHSADPICAAMMEESASQPGAVNGTQASKCPIRFLDKHTPEEVARYVETHKHELPRSHEICLRRYQHNEEQIKKLDSKYGNVVSMIEDLSHLHKPMLPEDEAPQHRSDVDRSSNDRVESWAQAVSVTTDPEADAEPPVEVDDDRQSHFDRPLKEVRVGESPSRPWGISVPVFEPSDNDVDHPMSPPPAPVRMPSPVQSAQTPVKVTGRKCPFDHNNPSALAGLGISCKPSVKEPSSPQHMLPEGLPFTPAKEAAPQASAPLPRPTFINPELSKSGSAQMVFTGPVFIGYPMEQAIQFMNQYQRDQ